MMSILDSAKEDYPLPEAQPSLPFAAKDPPELFPKFKSLTFLHSRPLLSL